MRAATKTGQGEMQMFGLGRKKTIEERAKALGDLMLLLVGCLETMSLAELVEANHHRGFVDSYVEANSLIDDHTYGFFECEPEKADFSFHVTYEKAGQRTVIAEGHCNYFGLVLSGFSGRHDIGADMKDALDEKELGRDAHALQAALLKFPGFSSMVQLYKRLGLS